MKRIRNLYNVYDGDKLVLEEVTEKELREKMGMPKLQATGYERKGIKMKGRYRIEKVGKERFEEIERTWKGCKSGITSECWEEWERVCSRLRGLPGLNKIRFKKKEEEINEIY